MTLPDGEILQLRVGDPQWFQFLTLVHSSDVAVPRSHRPRGLFHFNQRLPYQS